MAFSQEQMNKIVEVVKVKFTRSCPSCGQNKFTLADGLVALDLHDNVGTRGADVGKTPALPCIGLTCTTCGFTVLLNALILGLGKLLGIPEPAS